MKLLITGATGFLGSAVAARLRADGHDLVLPVRSASSPMPGSVLSPALEDMSTADWRTLLGGVEWSRPRGCHRSHWPGCAARALRRRQRDASARLAEAAAKAGVRRFVFISSIRAQVGQTSHVVQNERIVPAPTEPYGESKLAAERLIAAAFPSATHLRPPLIIGDAPKGNLGLMLRLARMGLPLPFGGLTAGQAVVSRDNLVDAIVLGVTGDVLRADTFVISDEPAPGMADMLRWLREGLNQPPRLFAVPTALLRLPATLVGKGEMFARLTEGLAVDSSKLRRAGWVQRQPTAEAFRTLARASLSGR